MPSAVKASNDANVPFWSRPETVDAVAMPTTLCRQRCAWEQLARFSELPIESMNLKVGDIREKFSEYYEQEAQRLQGHALIGGQTAQLHYELRYFVCCLMFYNNISPMEDELRDRQTDRLAASIEYCVKSYISTLLNMF